MNTDDIFTETQILALRLQATPDDPALHAEITALMMAMLENFQRKVEPLIQSVYDHNERLMRLLSQQHTTMREQADIIREQAELITQLATRLQELQSWQ